MARSAQKVIETRADEGYRSETEEAQYQERKGVNTGKGRKGQGNKGT